MIFLMLLDSSGIYFPSFHEFMFLASLVGCFKRSPFGLCFFSCSGLRHFSRGKVSEDTVHAGGQRPGTAVMNGRELLLILKQQ